LREEHAIAVHAHALITVNGYSLPLLFGEYLKQTGSFAGEIHCPEQGRMQLDASSVPSRDREQAIDQSSKAIHLLEDAPYGIAIRLAAIVFL